MTSHYQPHNILITGGAGFIGANCIRYLQKKNPELTLVNLDALTYAGSLDNLKDLPCPEKHHFIQGDICDRTLVDSLLKKFNIDTLIHFAAESHVDRSITGPAAFIQTNLIGTFTLLEATKKYWLEEKKWNAEQCRFHHISTDEVYGSLQINDPAFTEKNAYEPNSPYSASKAGSDHLVRAYFHTYDLPVTTSNCSNNYGPYQHPEKFIPTVIRHCLTQQSIPVYGNGSNIRDWLYVDDHCDAIWTIIQKGKLGETYNIGGDNEWNNLELAKFICNHFDQHFPREKPYAELINFVADRPGHDWRYAINADKIKHALNWQPQKTFAEGLRETVLHYAHQLTHI